MGAVSSTKPGTIKNAGTGPNTSGSAEDQRMLAAREAQFNARANSPLYLQQLIARKRDLGVPQALLNQQVAAALSRPEVRSLYGQDGAAKRVREATQRFGGTSRMAGQAPAALTALTEEQRAAQPSVDAEQATDRAERSANIEQKLQNIQARNAESYRQNAAEYAARRDERIAAQKARQDAAEARLNLQQQKLQEYRTKNAEARQKQEDEMKRQMGAAHSETIAGIMARREATAADQEARQTASDAAWAARQKESTQQLAEKLEERKARENALKQRQGMRTQAEQERKAVLAKYGARDTDEERPGSSESRLGAIRQKSAVKTAVKKAKAVKQIQAAKPATPVQQAAVVAASQPAAAPAPSIGTVPNPSLM